MPIEEQEMHRTNVDCKTEHALIHLLWRGSRFFDLEMTAVPFWYGWVGALKILGKTAKILVWPKYSVLQAFNRKRKLVW
jgi:hypothetical protein